MRIGLISDIHANAIALEAVLADIDRASVDQIILLGDAIDLGPQPREVMARLRSLDLRCILGNHDEFLLTFDALQTGNAWLDEVYAWTLGQLSAADFDYIRTFAPLIEIRLDPQTSLLCCHGSPRSNNDFILPTTTAADLDEMLTGKSATVLAAGHTHVQMSRQHRGMMIINVGSVGLPIYQPWLPEAERPRILPWAEYAIINWREGALNIELRRVPVDLAAIRQATLSSGMPGVADWLAGWIGLEEGS